jgi:hypothetical protein
MTDGRLAYTTIAALWDANRAEHRVRAAQVGLDCPDDVFEQLFHARRLDPTLMVVVGAIDWRDVRWVELQLSGAVLTQVHVHRTMEAAVDAARIAVATHGVVDERSEVVTAWQRDSTWLRAPVLVDGDVSGNRVSYELVIGATRLGTLLGLFDRGELDSSARHRVWVGRRR